MRSTRLRVSASLLALATLTTAACSTRAPETTGGTGGGGEGGGEGQVATDIGVDENTIRLGQLTDLTGPFAALSRSIVNAQQLHFDQLNAEGGVCGRNVEIVTRDHGYNVQTAVSLYQQLAGEVLGLVHVIGSPVNAALLQNYTQDEMLAVPAAWPSTLLENPQIMIVGSTYDYEMINLIDYMFQEGLLAEGDKIGHIFFEGEYGENGAIGSRHAAQERGLELIERRIRATDTDVTAQVTDLANQGVKAIALTVAPTQTASAAAVNASTGLNVPLLGNNPVFNPGTLDTPAGQALQQNLYVAIPWEQPASPQEETQQIVQQYQEAFPDAQLDGGVTWGYGSAAAFAEVLRQACENGDLTRAGVGEAFRQLSEVDVPVMPALDYTQEGQAPSKETFIFRPDPSAPGGLVRATEERIVGETAEAYQPATAEG
jgi:ABC-type branched-subunit amino acid transport system substrate-binding protein